MGRPRAWVRSNPIAALLIVAISLIFGTLGIILFITNPRQARNEANVSKIATENRTAILDLIHADEQRCLADRQLRIQYRLRGLAEIDVLRGSITLIRSAAALGAVDPARAATVVAEYRSDLGSIHILPVPNCRARFRQLRRDFHNIGPLYEPSPLRKGIRFLDRLSPHASTSPPSIARAAPTGASTTAPNAATTPSGAPPTTASSGGGGAPSSGGGGSSSPPAPGAPGPVGPPGPPGPAPPSLGGTVEHVVHGVTSTACNLTGSLGVPVCPQ